MARHEGKFDAAGEAEFDLDGLLGALGPKGTAEPDNRRAAIAHCLSASDGWRDAAARLGGAFATLESELRLTDGKE